MIICFCMGFAPARCTECALRRYFARSAYRMCLCTDIAAARCTGCVCVQILRPLGVQGTLAHRYCTRSVYRMCMCAGIVPAWCTGCLLVMMRCNLDPHCRVRYFCSVGSWLERSGLARGKVREEDLGYLAGCGCWMLLSCLLLQTGPDAAPCLLALWAVRCGWVLAPPVLCWMPPCAYSSRHWMRPCACSGEQCPKMLPLLAPSTIVRSNLRLCAKDKRRSL